MKIRLLSLLLLASCTHTTIHNHHKPPIVDQPYKAIMESSECFTDRAIFSEDGNLKEDFADVTAKEIAKKFNQQSYQKSQQECVSVDGTGKKVVVYMCPSGVTMKDHYCYPN